MKINRKTIKCFEAWCQKPPHEELISAEDFQDNDALRQRIISGPTNPATVLSIEELPLQLQDLLSGKKQEFRSVEILGDGRSLSLKKAKIWKLTVRDVGELFFEECEIGEIAVHQTADYRIKDSMIGTFTVLKEADEEKKKDKEERGYHVQDLTWEGGYLGQFNLIQEKTRAFVGNVSFDRIALPPTDQPHRVQWLRDTREALNARSNFVAAGIFHASELKLTRPKGWLRKISSAYWWASLGYQLGSNFGNSIGRPIGCLVAIIALLTALAFFSGTHLTSAEKGELPGWQNSLRGEDCSAKLLRAGVYALHAINPLNLFGSPVVVLKSPGWALVGGVFAVGGLAAVAFLLLSLRRRFKLE